MSITGSNNPFACEPVVFANANTIVSLGTITRDGNEFTFSVGFVWKINGVTYQNTAPVVLTIAEASVGFNRIDNALLNTSNTIELQQGNESDTIALRPVAPDTNIILTSWNISGTTIGDTEASILGTQFKKKTESLGFSDPSLSGTNAIIQLRPEGNSRYAFSNPGLISIDGFGTSLISVNPNAEAPYDGKDLFIENTGATPFTLKHDGAGTADVKFFFTDETDLIVPVGGKLWLKYGNPYCQLFFKSWSEVDLSTKLDKDTTAGVERAYIINADGSQGTKATSEFGGKTKYIIYKNFSISPMSDFTNWYRQWSDIAAFTPNADVTDTNAFSSDQNLFPQHPIPFAFKVKSINVNLRSNASTVTFDFAIRSFELPLGQVNDGITTNSTNNKIVGRKIVQQLAAGSQPNYSFTGTEIDNTTILSANSHLKLYIKNNSGDSAMSVQGIVAITIEEV